MVDLGSTIHRPPGFCKGLSGEGEERRARRREFGRAGCWGWAHDRKTPHLLLAKAPAFSSPLGEGEEVRPFEEIDTDARPSGYAEVSQERGKRGGFSKGLTPRTLRRRGRRPRPGGRGLCIGFQRQRGRWWSRRGDRALKVGGGGRMLFGRPSLALGFPCHP